MKKLEVKPSGNAVCCYLDGKEIPLAKAVKIIKDNALSVSKPYTVKIWSAGIKQNAEFSSKRKTEREYGTFAEAYHAATRKRSSVHWEVRIEGGNGYYFNTSKRDWATGKSFENLSFNGEEFIIGAAESTVPVEIDNIGNAPLDDGSNDEPEEDFLATLDTTVDTDAETDELVDEPLTGTESAVTFPVVPDQFAALELADDYFPNLNISGKLTKSNGILTAINADGVQVEIHDDYLEINNNGDIWRIDYDIPETAFCRALRAVTLRMVNEGATPATFEIVGKSGLIYTYTEATLKVVRAETQAEHDARINSTPKTQKEIDAVTSLTVAKLWGILRKKQQALKAIMTEKNIVAARKYSVQIAEVKLIIDSINNFKNAA